MPDEAKPEMIDLQVENPNMIARGHFGLMIPKDLCPESFEAVKKQLEFRRKCMNQGFDNLLELLEMTKDILLAAHERAAKSSSEKSE